MAKLIWIASYPRSGNTWTRLFINALIKLHTGSAVVPLARADEWQRADPSRYFETWEINPRWYRPVLPAALGDASAEQMAAARAQAQGAIAASARGPVLTKTHHANISYAGHASIDFSLTDRVIYLLRNPLDVAPSLADHFGMPLDQAIGMMGKHSFVMPAHENAASEAYCSWSLNVSSWTRQVRPYLHVVRYEDAIDKPLQTFMRIGRFLGFRTAPADVEKAAQAVAFDKARQLEARHRQSGGKQRPGTFFRQGRSGGWKNALDREQIERLVRVHGSVMQHFGYLDAGGDVHTALPFEDTAAGQLLLKAEPWK